MKTIWYVTQGYSVRGGHEAHVLHFASELRSHGFDTRILVVDPLPRKAHLFMDILAQREISLISVSDCLRVKLNLASACLYVPWAASRILRRQCISPGILRRFLLERWGPRWLTAEINAMRPDVVHVHGRLPETFWSALPANRTALHHGTEGRLDETWDHEEVDAFRGFANNCARNFAPGQGVISNLQKEFGINRAIETVYTICPDSLAEANRVPVQSTRTGADTVFGILCRMTPEKGVDVILQALLKVRDALGRVCFEFAGAGDLGPTIEAFAREHDLNDVTWVPSFNSPVDVLLEFDVFVHPSHSDAMPMAIAEALMCGLPCIGTRVGGIPDLVRDGQEGVIIAPGSVDALADAMLMFARMSLEQRRGFAERARLRYDEVCAAPKVAKVLADHYMAMMAEANECKL